MAMEFLVANFAGNTRQVQSTDGRTYIVAPLTMIVPGVLNGSRGALYYPEEEIARNHVAWNEVPLLLYHPSCPATGRPQTAKDKGVWERSGLGVIRNATIRKGKLTGYGWFDVERVQNIAPDLLMSLRSGSPIELSTGLYTDNYPAPQGANWRGRPYDYVARNYRPDHLAILPDQIGACSLKDGCGVGVLNEFSPQAILAAKQARQTREKASAQRRTSTQQRISKIKTEKAASSKEKSAKVNERIAQLKQERADRQAKAKEQLQSYARNVGMTLNLESRRDVNNLVNALVENLFQPEREGVQISNIWSAAARKAAILARRKGRQAVSSLKSKAKAFVKDKLDKLKAKVQPHVDSAKKTARSVGRLVGLGGKKKSSAAGSGSKSTQPTGKSVNNPKTPAAGGGNKKPIPAGARKTAHGTGSRAASLIRTTSPSGKSSPGKGKSKKADTFADADKRYKKAQKAGGYDKLAAKEQAAAKKTKPKASKTTIQQAQKGLAKQGLELGKGHTDLKTKTTSYQVKDTKTGKTKTMTAAEIKEKLYTKRGGKTELTKAGKDAFDAQRKRREAATKRASSTLGGRDKGTKATGKSTDGYVKSKDRWHNKAFKKKPTNNSEGEQPMPLSARRRKAIIGAVVANSKAYTPEILNELSDDSLVAVQEMVATTNTTSGGCTCGKGTTTQNGAPMSAEEPDGDEPPAKKKAPPFAKKEGKEGVATTTNQGQEGQPKQMTDEEWLASVPPTFRAVIQNAQRIEAKGRADLIEKLTANVAADKKEATVKVLNAKPLEDLELMVSLLPEKTTTNSTVNRLLEGQRKPLFTGAAAPTSNQGDEVVNNKSGKETTNNAEADDDLLMLPTYNWEEIATANRKN